MLDTPRRAIDELAPSVLDLPAVTDPPAKSTKPLTVQEALTKAVAAGKVAWVAPLKERTPEEAATLHAQRRRQRQARRAGRRASAR